MPGRPAWLNDVLSVPPVARLGGGVVGRAGRHRRGVEMAAEHAVFGFLVAAGDLRDGVIGRVPLWVPLVRDVEAERPRRSVGKRARDAAVIVVAHDERWHLLRFVV